jgi:membrane fusion protein (multidrug efflux system)
MREIKNMSKLKEHKHLFIGIIVVLLFILIIAHYRWKTEMYPSTDDAYVNAHLVNIAPKVSGAIQSVYVNNNQRVHKGDLLISLDPVDYNLQVEKSNKDMALAEQQAAIAKKQITLAQTNIVRAKAEYNLAHAMAVRYTNLYLQKSGSKQDMQNYVNDSIQAKEAVKQAETQLTQANVQYQAALTQKGMAKLAIENSQNDIGYTKIHAPVDGYIADLNLQTGELVGQGQKLFGLVDTNKWWIDANFKETQLERMKPGQPVDIVLDIYDHHFKGVVQSISFASGSTFSLLPAENATGNWVKVTQRFTVMIKVEDEKEFPLRVGASCEVTVDTTNNE